MRENTWPDPSRPGVPLHCAQSGAHRIRWRSHHKETDMLWSHKLGLWVADDRVWYLRSDAAQKWEYIGPCVPPGTPAAPDLVELAAKIVETRADHVIKVNKFCIDDINYSKQVAWLLWDVAHDIRAISRLRAQNADGRHSDMRETVARALTGWINGKRRSCPDFETLSEAEKSAYLEQADAAIAVMRGGCSFPEPPRNQASSGEVE
jgi:hypothetical protein